MPGPRIDHIFLSITAVPLAIKSPIRNTSLSDHSGRINAVKMTLMPWILYLFYSLPISIPRKEIAKFQSKIVDFIWGKKGHCLSRDILFRSKKPQSHLFHNLSFQSGRNIQAFRWWLNKGLFRIRHFFTSSGPITLGICLSKLEMSDAERFRLSQIRHFLHTLWIYKSVPPIPPLMNSGTLTSWIRGVVFH